MAHDRFLTALWNRQTELGMNARQFAEFIGVHESTVSLLKAGKREPGVDFINAVLHRFPELLGYLLPTAEVAESGPSRRVEV